MLILYLLEVSKCKFLLFSIEDNGKANRSAEKHCSVAFIFNGHIVLNLFDLTKLFSSLRLLTRELSASVLLNGFSNSTV